jgi:diaminopimelate decarboxylase
VVDEGPDVVLLKDVRAERSKGVTISVTSQQLNDRVFENLLAVLKTPDHQGRCALNLKVRTGETGGDALVTMTTDYKVAATDEVANALQRVFPGGCGLRIQ